MKSIAARYDGRPPPESDSRAPDADCSSSSVSILTASVSFRTSRSRGCSIFSCSNSISSSALTLVVVLRSPAIDVLLPVLAHHDDWRGGGRLERKREIEKNERVGSQPTDE
jgi:hypothetical protein